MAETPAATPAANDQPPAVQLIVPPLTPGVRTSEFWAALLLSLGSFASAAADVLPSKWAALCATGATIAFIISRGLAKRQAL